MGDVMQSVPSTGMVGVCGDCFRMAGRLDTEDPWQHMEPDGDDEDLYMFVESDHEPVVNMIVLEELR